MGTHLLVPQYLRIKGFITGVLDGLCIDGRKSRALFKGCIGPVITITLDGPDLTSSFPPLAGLSAAASGVGTTEDILLIKSIGDPSAHDLTTTLPFTWDVVG